MTFEKPNLKINFRDCGLMEEIPDKSVDLFISGSLYLGKEWMPYKHLFERLYIQNAKRVLKDNGFLVIQQTDGYFKNSVFTKSKCLLDLLLPLGIGWKLIDHKIWKRCSINFFQVPFSNFYIFTKDVSNIGRNRIKNKDYMKGIWEYPQDKGSQMNSWSYDFCKMLIDSFTKEGQTILDPLAGFSKLLILGSKMNRNCMGYEIDESLLPNIQENYNKI
jgi:hypothetical protein